MRTQAGHEVMFNHVYVQTSCAMGDPTVRLKRAQPNLTAEPAEMLSTS